MSDRLYFRQLLAGRDFATGDPVATQMVNFVYLVGDREQGDCLIVDPAWNVRELVDIIEADGLRPSGALCTHYHPDHVGGTFFGHTVEGLATLHEICDVPVHVHKAEADGVRQVTGIEETSMVKHEGGDRVHVGNVSIELVHTPGHTPGSQCFLLDGRLLAGDTLFVNGCGRVDLPGGDADELYRTLTQRLARLPGETILYPGHHYDAEPKSTLARHRDQGGYMKTVSSTDDWRDLMDNG